MTAPSTATFAPFAEVETPLTLVPVTERLFRWFRRWRAPRFQLSAEAGHPPLIEPHCTFSSPEKISLGSGVRFLRGAMVFADPEGEIRIADHSTICRHAILQSMGGCIRVGENSSIGDFCSLYGQGGLHIGRDVMIASGCRLIPNEHTYSDREAPISEQPCESKGITIEDGAWIGANAVILDGVTVGKGAVIGAGSVVTHSIPPFAIAAGVPARVIKQRPD